MKQNDKKLKVYVPLLDEGTGVWRETYALAKGDGLYELLAPEDYDPEDEYWDLLPGSLVRLEQKVIDDDGSLGWIARHSDPRLIHVFVNSVEQSQPFLRETYALPLENDTYQLLPTPHYHASQQWEFSPGSIVRIKKMASPYNSYYWLVTGQA